MRKKDARDDLVIMKYRLDSLRRKYNPPLSTPVVHKAKKSDSVRRLYPKLDQICDDY